MDNWSGRTKISPTDFWVTNQPLWEQPLWESCFITGVTVEHCKTIIRALSAWWEVFYFRWYRWSTRWSTVSTQLTQLNVKFFLTRTICVYFSHYYSHNWILIIVNVNAKSWCYIMLYMHMYCFAAKISRQPLSQPCARSRRITHYTQHAQSKALGGMIISHFLVLMSSMFVYRANIMFSAHLLYCVSQGLTAAYMHSYHFQPF